MLRIAIPYLLAILLGASAGFEVEHLIAGRRLAAEEAAHARDNEQHARDMKAVSDAALATEQKAIADGQVAAGKIEVMDAQLTKEDKTMKPTIVTIAVLSLLALSGCASPSATVLPVSTVCQKPPAPPAWAMVPPPAQTSTQRLRSAFSGVPVTTTVKSTN
jgi:hypothetical protein